MDCCIRNMKVVVSTVEGYMEVEEILSFCLFSMRVELGGLLDRKSTRLNSSHHEQSRMPSSA